MKASVLRARYWRIVFFFGVVTAGFIFWEIILPRIGLRGLADRKRSERGRRTAVRFRALAISMGGLMIKVGQFMSARLDVLPAEITRELAGLQDEVPAVAFGAIREVAQSELGLPLAEHYAWFDETPLAAASLGQAHRARLREADAAEHGFGDVVVKVQRPHIQQVIEVDLAALRRVGGWLQRYRPVRERADVRALVEEFAVTTLEEVDYLAEADNAEKFAANFADDPRVTVPRIIRKLSASRVLTLEDVSAIRLGDHDAITAAGIDRAEVASVLADTYLQQIFTDAFFHADPHPGNIFVTPRPDAAPGAPSWTLTYIDFGMMGRVPDRLRAGLRDLVIAAGTQDGARMVKGLKNLDALLPSADLELIERATMEVFERFGGLGMDALRDIDEAEMMKFGRDFRELLLAMPFQLPENLLLLGRAIGILSGNCTGLDPEFNIWAKITPYATKLLSDEDDGSPFKTILTEAVAIGRVAIGLPGRLDRVLTQAERGDLAMSTPSLTKQIRRLERSVARAGSALVFAALLVAGALLDATDPGLGRLLMLASVLPLGWGLIAGRRGRDR